MRSYKNPFVIFLGFVFFSSSIAFAEGVFLNKKRSSHELTSAEKRQMNVEFLQKFGSNVSAPQMKSNNPWEAKKQKQESTRKVTWAECRDYAIQQRNRCYKEGRSAYSCERFYEARSNKCNDDY